MKIDYTKKISYYLTVRSRGLDLYCLIKTVPNKEYCKPSNIPASIVLLILNYGIVLSKKGKFNHEDVRS